uniref:Uncharacterized protein n=1 Tax=Pithovirus LCPAC304 TaxID=2506594 RepID=A0A481ZB52_9VIRU|nr:MAG: hypothetical protein LCPAC304_02320 [Pithovirus LCPAC304]
MCVKEEDLCNNSRDQETIKRISGVKHAVRNKKVKYRLKQSSVDHISKNILEDIVFRNPSKRFVTEIEPEG